MKVLWLGMNDETGCVWHWHELRLCLKEQHGVILKGPGYSYPDNPRIPLSSLLDGDEDWIVLDDCNAMGYVNIVPDVRPNAKVAWREHDWHNKRRQANAEQWHYDLVMGCYRRDGWYPKHFKLVPHAINTERFHPGNGQLRPWQIGMYGKTCKHAYPERIEARQAIKKCSDSWLPTHGGYWRDGRGSGPITRYNDQLAHDLRHVACLYVSGGRWNGMVLKYLEGAASGCLLMGNVPCGWEESFPKDSMLPCEPGEVGEFADWFADHEEQRAEFARIATERALKEHSIEARAEQIMEVLRGH